MELISLSSLMSELHRLRGLEQTQNTFSAAIICTTRDDAELDPMTDAARIRAFFCSSLITHAAVLAGDSRKRM